LILLKNVTTGAPRGTTGGRNRTSGASADHDHWTARILAEWARRYEGKAVKKK